MSAELCGADYVRPGGTVLSCQYVAGHPSDRHSWFAVEAEDEVERVMPVALDSIRASAQQFIDAIEDGLFDPYLEAILTAGHGRKLHLRRTPGFDRSLRRRL